jgi:NAD(P)-dependent dehydrogenase (short-subunit alcohol dehydrogenase family)
MGQLDGKIAIVTGTSRGVGVGIAKRLLEEGATVAGCSRRELDALPGADAIEGARDRSVQWVCDQGDWRQIDGFVKRVVERFGRLDILINNAGGTIPTPHVEDVPAFVAKIQGSPAADDSYERTVLFHALAIQNNLISPLWFALRACREMAKQDSTGSIINISSGASHPAGSPTLVSYGAAKAGLNQMTRSLAQEWGPKIRVNCLALGPTLTEGFRTFALGKDDPAGEEYFQNVPIRRGGEPEEVGNACVFLCAGGADIINGTTIYMDGGMLPGVLYERGIQPIKQMLAARADRDGQRA